MFHPKEGILLLRGKTTKGVLEVKAVVVPPSGVHGYGFSSFSWWMMPIDLSFVGVAHSHPSGVAVPSQEDLLHAAGRIIVIAGFPYSGRDCLEIYDYNGNKLLYEVE
jgi:proteasome lid subunit RPN8/RPN11